MNEKRGETAVKECCVKREWYTERGKEREIHTGTNQGSHFKWSCLGNIGHTSPVADFLRTSDTESERGHPIHVIMKHEFCSDLEDQTHRFCNAVIEDRTDFSFDTSNYFHFLLCETSAEAPATCQQITLLPFSHFIYQTTSYRDEQNAKNTKN